MSVKVGHEIIEHLSENAIFMLPHFAR